jgi:hypothetical protein
MAYVFERQIPSNGGEISGTSHARGHASLAEHAISSNHAYGGNSATQRSSSDAHRLRSTARRSTQI